MTVKVDPFVIPIPGKWSGDPELSATVNYLWRYLYDLRERTGGGTDYISDLIDDVLALDVSLDVAENDIDSLQAADVAIDARLDALEASPGTVAGSTEHDFGTAPVYDAQFTITDANITSTSIVLVTPGGAATGRTADDWQFDGASIGVVAGTGSATCYVTFSPGPIVGKRKFNYTVI